MKAAGNARNRVARPSRLLSAALAGSALLASSGLAWSQDDDESILPPGMFGQEEGNDLRQQMIELFHQVERNLQTIDTDLNQAGTGEIALAEVESSGIEKLLRASNARGDKVVSDIDKILEIAQQMGGT
ncbi:MAG: hypothetical protein MJA83_04065 [Gammaproteobacteria bacterium]|nr:hypothetical protein [Gammaproteobacteria bacterium]